MSGQNRKMVIAYKQFLSTWCHPNERKVLGNVLLLYTGCLQHITNKVGEKPFVKSQLGTLYFYNSRKPVGKWKIMII